MENNTMEQGPNTVIRTWLERLEIVSCDKRYFTMTIVATVIAIVTAYEKMNKTPQDTTMHTATAIPFLTELFRTKSSTMVLLL